MSTDLDKNNNLNEVNGSGASKPINSDGSNLLDTSEGDDGLNKEGALGKVKLFFVKHFQIIIVLLSTVAGTIKYINSRDVSEFYGITKIFFEYDPTYRLVSCLVLAIIITLLIFSPIIYKDSSEKHKFKIKKPDALFYSMISVIYPFFAVSVAFFDFKIFKLRFTTILVFIVYIAITIFIGISNYMYLINSKENKSTNKENSKENNNLENEKCSDKLRNKNTLGSMSMYAVLNIIILTTILFNVLKPENIKTYDVFIDGDGKENIVIKYDVSNALTMRYYDVLDDEGSIAINTGKHRVMNLNNMELELKRFNCVYNNNYGLITLDFNGGTSDGELEDSVTYAIINEHTISELEELINNLVPSDNIKKYGTSFDFWSLDKNGGSDYFGNSTSKKYYISNDPLTLYAQYKSN